MKKATMILAVAFAAGFLTISTVQAIHPMQITELMLSINKEIVIEEEIKLQQWMYTPESFLAPSIEKSIELSSWMVNTNEWIETEKQFTEDSEIVLEEWMINTFDMDNRTIALEDWMTRISG
ncbi:MAG TPA: hypothetical protein ENI20_14270 [Bacteroides sp.]|nr:hypothetical protein [Bacteroides sp.]